MNMKESPILFSAPMVCAILEGRKTQTRRVLKRQPFLSYSNPPNFTDTAIGDLFLCPDRFPTTTDRGNVMCECTSVGVYHCMGQTSFVEKHCPYGVPGGRLWVRETWTNLAYNEEEEDAVLLYRADGEEKPDELAWRSPIFMPRWASRITLEITDVRVQRVQEISEEDCISEGAVKPWLSGWPIALVENKCAAIGTAVASGKWVFRDLWDSINAKRGGGWGVNPWVWALTFKRVS